MMILFTHVLGGRIYSPSKDGSQLKNEENVVRTTEYYPGGKRKGIGVFFTKRTVQEDILNESHWQ